MLVSSSGPLLSPVARTAIGGLCMVTVVALTILMALSSGAPALLVGGGLAMVASLLLIVYLVVDRMRKPPALLQESAPPPAVPQESKTPAPLQGRGFYPSSMEQPEPEETPAGVRILPKSTELFQDPLDLRPPVSIQAQPRPSEELFLQPREPSPPPESPQEREERLRRERAQRVERGFFSLPLLAFDASVSDRLHTALFRVLKSLTAGYLHLVKGESKYDEAYAALDTTRNALPQLGHLFWDERIVEFNAPDKRQERIQKEKQDYIRGWHTPPYHTIRMFENCLAMLDRIPTWLVQLIGKLDLKPLNEELPELVPFFHQNFLVNYVDDPLHSKILRIFQALALHFSERIQGAPIAASSLKILKHLEGPLSRVHFFLDAIQGTALTLFVPDSLQLEPPPKLVIEPEPPPTDYWNKRIARLTAEGDREAAERLRQEAEKAEARYLADHAKWKTDKPRVAVLYGKNFTSHLEQLTREQLELQPTIQTKEAHINELRKAADAEDARSFLQRQEWSTYATLERELESVRAELLKPRLEVLKGYATSQNALEKEKYEITFEEADWRKHWDSLSEHLAALARERQKVLERYPTSERLEELTHQFATNPERHKKLLRPWHAEQEKIEKLYGIECTRRLVGLRNQLSLMKAGTLKELRKERDALYAQVKAETHKLHASAEWRRYEKLLRDSETERKKITKTCNKTFKEYVQQLIRKLLNMNDSTVQALFTLLGDAKQDAFKGGFARALQQLAQQLPELLQPLSNPSPESDMHKVHVEVFCQILERFCENLSTEGFPS